MRQQPAVRVQEALSSGPLFYHRMTRRPNGSKHWIRRDPEKPSLKRFVEGERRR